jgi:hypothetical protein
MPATPARGARYGHRVKARCPMPVRRVAAGLPAISRRSLSQGAAVGAGPASWRLENRASPVRLGGPGGIAPRATQPKTGVALTAASLVPATLQQNRAGVFIHACANTVRRRLRVLRLATHGGAVGTRHSGGG